MKVSRLLLVAIFLLLLFLTCQGCYVCSVVDRLKHEVEGGL